MSPELGVHALDRARRLVDAGTASLGGGGARRLLGVTGAPGAGKSTVAAALAHALGPDVVVVPMDGFHLAQRELVRLGRSDRKGAPDTFDAGGFVALLDRVRAQRPGGPPVWAPAFERDLEEPVAGAIAVEAHVPLVVVEGNYLLHDGDGWSGAADRLDEAWYVETDEAVRVERLVARHVRFGKDPDAARAWALGPDQRNAEVVARTRERADLVLRL